MGMNRLSLTASCLALALAASGCATTGSGGPKARDGSSTRTAKQASAIKGTRVVATDTAPSPVDPSILRVPPKVMRIWIAPWEDSRGDLHAPGYLYTEIEPRRWSLGAPAEPEPVALIRPLQVERRESQPNSARSSRDTGAVRTPNRAKAPESRPNLFES